MTDSVDTAAVHSRIEEGQGHDLYDAGSGHPRPHHLCLDIYADTFHVKLLLCTAAVSTLSVMPHAWVYMWLCRETVKNVESALNSTVH
jgi:hypothetical protein